MANPVQTTLSGAITVNQNTFGVASATGFSAPSYGVAQQCYVLDPGATKGELMTVQAVNGTQITVSRLDQFKMPHVSGALVILQTNANYLEPYFVEVDPNAVPISVPNQTSVLNAVNGNQWLYSSVTKTWVPGFGNTTAPLAVTAAVASAAGVVLPSGPLFHITGALAITGFTLPVGCASGNFSVIPDGTFTWTTGDGSIALAGTAVISKTLTFTYDFSVSKWFPSYIA